MDNEVEVGQLFNFQVELEGSDGGRWRTLIKDQVIPTSHVGSFGKNTETSVLYNLESKYREVIFEPNQKPWHFEKSKV